MKTPFITLKKEMLMKYHRNTFQKHKDSISLVFKRNNSNGKKLHYFWIQRTKNALLLEKIIPMKNYFITIEKYYANDYLKLDIIMVMKNCITK